MSHDEDGFTQALGDSVDMVASMPSPRYIKSHLTWDLLPEQMPAVKPKLVYVARNPKDMCVSYYHYCQLVHRLAGGFEEFAELFLQDQGERVRGEEDLEGGAVPSESSQCQSSACGLSDSLHFP